jgi:hypothetical protein
LRQARFGLASCWRKVGEALHEKQEKATKRLKSLALPREVVWCCELSLQIRGFLHYTPRFWESLRGIVLQNVSKAIPKTIRREDPLRTLATDWWIIFSVVRLQTPVRCITIHCPSRKEKHHAKV